MPLLHPATTTAAAAHRNISTASCILANLAMQVGRTLAWDPVNQRIPGDEEANRLLRRPSASLGYTLKRERRRASASLSAAS